MILFRAAVYTNAYKPGQNRHEKLNEFEKELVKGVSDCLESWHYVGKQKFVDQMRADGARIFLDSGAFSAYTLGVDLKVSDYCEYISRNMDIIRVEDGTVMASVLDGIGDPLKTYQNQLEMEERGFRPMPCYHFGEDERYLDYYVRNYEYITLGGLVGASTDSLTKWLDEIWNKHLMDGSGRARLKVHAFGITSIPIMGRYDWYSVDSSSWIQSAAFGTIVTPEWGSLAVSDKNPARHDAGQHAMNLTLTEQQAVFDILEKQGFTYERLSTIYESRAAYNLWSYGVICATINASRNYKKFLQLRQTLF